MSLDQRETLRRLHFTDEQFEATKLEWGTVEAIHADFARRRGTLENEMEFVRRKVAGFMGVHSTRARIKDELSLVGKCIRKRLADPSQQLDVDSYLSRFDDLVGVRAIHLVKPAWVFIHQQVLSTWELHGKPVANIRASDLRGKGVRGQGAPAGLPIGPLHPAVGPHEG